MIDMGRNLFYALLTELLVAIIALLVKDDKKKMAIILGVGTIIAGLVGFSHQILSTSIKITDLISFTATPSETPSFAQTDQTNSTVKIAVLDRTGKLAISNIEGVLIEEIQTNITDMANLSWSPNGIYILASTKDPSKQESTYLINVDTREIYEWAKPMGTDNFNWSPTSDYLSLNLYDNGWQLDIASIYGDNRKTIYQGWSINGEPQWSPKGKSLALSGIPSQSSLLFHIYLINANTGEIEDITPAGVEKALFGSGWLSANHFGINANIQGEWTQQVVDIDTKNISPLLSTSPIGEVIFAGLSPSRSKVIYSVNEPDNSWSLYLANSASSSSEQIWHTEQAVLLFPISWSPSENSILFGLQTGDGGTNYQNFTITLDSKSNFLLPGESALLLPSYQKSDIFSSSRDWLDENQLIVNQSLGEEESKFILVDYTGTVLAELCLINSRSSCAIWAP